MEAGSSWGPQAGKLGRPVTKPRVLVAAMTYDYGIPERGFGYEYYNTLPALRSLPIELRQFDYAQEIIDQGYWVAQANLKRLVEEWRPDVLLCGMFVEQIDRDVMSWISGSTPTVTIGWFSDDQWRFDSYSRHWARALNWVVTTDAAAVPRYRDMGQKNVVLSQWAVNEAVYHPTSSGLKYEVTFVGQAYGERRRSVELLRRQGFDVRAWGPGWPQGKVSQEEMVDIFSASRVNLNFSASSYVPPGQKRPSAQIKGRVFEVPACGGLLLTDSAPEIERYYVPDHEIVLFESSKDLAERVRYLLDHEDERVAIACAGHARTMREHTWARRYADILAKVGVVSLSAEGWPT